MSCKVCQKDNQDEFMILCDGCDDAYHIFCLKGCTCCGELPKGSHLSKSSTAIPDGDWFCKFCSDSTALLSKKSSKSPSCCKIYAFGDNTCKQLGLGKAAEQEDIVKTPTLVTELSTIPVAQLSAGDGFTIALTTDGDIYSAGNGCEGRTGHPDIIHEFVPSFRRISTMDSRPKSEGPVKSVVTGKSFALAVTESGTLYSWGDGTSGQLGHQENKNKKVPKKNSALRQMDLNTNLIGAGSDFALCTSRLLKEDDAFNTDVPGMLLTWGANAHGQLGDKSGRNQWVPKGLNKENRKSETPVPTEDVTPEDVDIHRDIRAVGGGCHHAVALVGTPGSVWTWGSGVLGQLGHPIKAKPTTSKFSKPRVNVLVPRFVAALRNENIIAIACGLNFTVAVSSESMAFTWGCNKFGQLGLGSKEVFVELPTVISGLQVRKVSAGDEHCLALSQDSKQVFAWGKASEGQLGIETDSKFVSVPTKVEIITGAKADVCCGSNFSFIIQSYGKPGSKTPLLERTNTAAAPKKKASKAAGGKKKKARRN